MERGGTKVNPPHCILISQSLGLFSSTTHVCFFLVHTRRFFKKIIEELGRVERERDMYVNTLKEREGRMQRQETELQRQRERESAAMNEVNALSNRLTTTQRDAGKPRVCVCVLCQFLPTHDD